MGSDGSLSSPAALVGCWSSLHAISNTTTEVIGNLICLLSFVLSNGLSDLNYLQYSYCKVVCVRSLDSRSLES